jgi:hypothetical protein
LLFSDRVVFAPDDIVAAVGSICHNAVGKSEVTAAAAAAAGVVVLLAADVESVSARKGWMGSSWLMVAGQGQQLLLGGMSGEVAAAVKADIAQLIWGSHAASSHVDNNITIS